MSLHPDPDLYPDGARFEVRPGSGGQPPQHFFDALQALGGYDNGGDPGPSADNTWVVMTVGPASTRSLVTALRHEGWVVIREIPYRRDQAPIFNPGLEELIGKPPTPDAILLAERSNRSDQLLDAARRMPDELAKPFLAGAVPRIVGQPGESRWAVVYSLQSMLSVGLKQTLEALEPQEEQGLKSVAAAYINSAYSIAEALVADPADERTAEVVKLASQGFASRNGYNLPPYETPPRGTLQLGN